MKYLKIQKNHRFSNQQHHLNTRSQKQDKNYSVIFVTVFFCYVLYGNVNDSEALLYLTLFESSFNQQSCFSVL